VLAVAVCLVTYFIEILIDNSYARMKWQIAINASWIVAITLGFVNLLVIYFVR
jgi:NADH:ubiquinone oxidoreductase subunit H